MDPWSETAYAHFGTYTGVTMDMGRVPNQAYRVLIVDNDEEVHAKAIAELATLGDDVVARHARTTEEAAELVKNEFFNAAFVDVILGKTRGTSVLRILNANAPSCAVFVMSRRFHDRADQSGAAPSTATDILNMIGPTFCPVAVVDKTAGDPEWFEPALAPLVEEWRERHVEIRGLEAVVKAIAEKVARIQADLKLGGKPFLAPRSDPEQIGHEVGYLLRGIFGSMGPRRGHRPLIEVSVFRAGFSSSVALEVAPQLWLSALEDAIPGNRCVVKIGPVTEITSEADRYERVVRFGLRLDYRVEMFSVVSGDALAALCYSFAGGNAGNIRSFDDLLFDQDDAQWRTIVDTIFAPETSNWYSIRAEAPPLRTHFQRAHGAPLDRAIDLLDEWLTPLIDRLGTAKRTNKGLRLGPRYLIPLPSKRSLALPGVVRPTNGCLIHGDLHGGNIVVDEGLRPYFIDFQNSGLGPRLLDFAALQATARFSHVAHLGRHRPTGAWAGRANEEELAVILASFDDERRHAKNLLSAGSRDRPMDGRWLTVAEALNDALSANFKDAAGEEVLWTYWAYAVSLFRFVHMEWYRKVRLLVWTGALSLQLETYNAGGGPARL